MHIFVQELLGAFTLNEKQIIMRRRNIFPRYTTPITGIDLAYILHFV